MKAAERATRGMGERPGLVTMEREFSAAKTICSFAKKSTL